MPLGRKGKFIFAIGIVVTCSQRLFILQTSTLQHKLAINQAEQQARMLHKQILFTRHADDLPARSTA